MGDICCTRVWQLKPGVAATDVEALASSGVVEMLRWIPGTKQFSFYKINNIPPRYLMQITFVDVASYIHWRQIEEEAPDYWERFASVQMYWEQMCHLESELVGECVIDHRLKEEI